MGKVILALILVGAAIGGWFLFQKMKLDGQADSFQGKLVEYETIKFPPAPEGVRDGTLAWAGGKVNVSASQLPPRSGKMVVIRPRAIAGTVTFAEDRMPRVDPVWRELGDAARASSPEEAGTLVVAQWSLEDSQGYVDPNNPISGPPGVRRVNVAAVMGKKVATLRVYDLKRQVLTGTWRLEGDLPPDRVKREDVDDLQGPPVKGFLEAMPGT